MGTINGLENISSLFKRGQSSEDLIQEAAERRESRRSERGNNRSERAEERVSQNQERREARRAEREQGGDEPINVLPVETPPPSETKPTPTEPEKPGSNDPLDIQGLAELYVRQFEEGSGTKLSDDEFKEKATDVANFYSNISNGEDRLDAIVFANDNETVA